MEATSAATASGELSRHASAGADASYPPRTRIAILDHTAILGGGEIALLNLSRAIDVRRFDLLVILFSDGPLRKKLEDSHIATMVLPLDPRIVHVHKDDLGGGTLLRLRDVWLSFCFSLRLRRELIRQRIDIVHTNSLKSDLLGGVAGRLAFIPVIWHIRDRIASDYMPGPVAFVFRVLTRLIPQRVVANSNATLRTLGLSGDHPPKNSRFRVAHDGAEISDQVVTPPARDYLVAGLVGRISPWKGQHIFLKAISLIRPQFPTARFQIIGAALFSETAYEKKMHDLAVSLGVSDIVEFTGFRNDVAQWVDQMDVLVHASTIGEPFGQVVLEGMAAGKPVVATRGGGVPEFVQDGVTGLLVTMGDAQSLADAMAKLLSDAALRKQLGARARQHVVDGFTVAHTAKNVQMVYESLIMPRRA